MWFLTLLLVILGLFVAVADLNVVDRVWAHYVSRIGVLVAMAGAALHFSHVLTDLTNTQGRYAFLRTDDDTESEAPTAATGRWKRLLWFSWVVLGVLFAFQSLASVPGPRASLQVRTSVHEGNAPMVYFAANIPATLDARETTGGLPGRGVGADRSATQPTAAVSTESEGAEDSLAEPEPVEVVLPPITGTASVVAPAAVAFGTDSPSDGR